MELLISDYYISGIKNPRNSKFDAAKTLLWVLYADSIPPHLGISSESKYFSLKANGKDESTQISTIIDVIEKKKIKTLCFELVSDLDLKNLPATFNRYQKTVPNEITCLNPIKDVLDIGQPQKLTELLNLLYNQGKIANVFGYNIDEKFPGIKNYDVADIHARLNSLSNG